jgi:release factor glutamine methyltransferase
VTFYEATVRARTLLRDAGILPDTATRDAELLARHALGWDLATWLARRGEPATDVFLATYDRFIARRRTREPIAYIRGVQEFYGRDFVVGPAVLIPRPETELLVDNALAFLRTRRSHETDRRPIVVDVGTGSGCIAITVALELPEAAVHAVDISTDALATARENARRLGATDRVRFIHGSLLTESPRPVDLILANPPYVAERDRRGLSREVGDYEPSVALFGGDDGWRTIRSLLQEASAALAQDGLMLMELGYGQSEQLPEEISRIPDLELGGIEADLQGIPRVARIVRRSVANG